MSADDALVELGRWLRTHRYHFVTTTPASHARVNAREDETRSLRGALGWSRRFRPGSLPPVVESLLGAAGALHHEDGWLRSQVRFSSLGEELFCHSGFPTREADSVFFGPDTYRFVAFLRRALRPTGRLVDVGTGSGAGGLAVRERAGHLLLTDVNPAALRFAATNTAIAGARAELLVSDVLAGVPGPIDAVIANPPYLVDAEHRLYRDGGGALGFDLALRIVDESLARLSPGGQLLLYTGSPVVDGRHPLEDALVPRLGGHRLTWEELDPDVFGEELDEPGYEQVERIAAVGITIDLT